MELMTKKHQETDGDVETRTTVHLMVTVNK